MRHPDYRPVPGDIDIEAGRVFIMFQKDCANGEWWGSPESYYRKMAKNRAHSMRRRSNPESRAADNAKKRAYAKTERARAAERLRRKKQSRKDSNNARVRRRRAEDPLFKLKGAVRSRMGEAFRSKGFPKTGITQRIIGCPFDTLMEFIEAQFKPGMTWENMGKWHIDHFIPMAAAKNARSVVALSNYTNLQPLWGKENLDKNAKMPTAKEVAERFEFVNAWIDQRVAA